MDMTKYHVKIKLTEPLLGTVPKNPAVYATYIAGKAAELGLISPEQAAEETATVETLEEKGWTGFHKDETGHFLYDYAIRGFLTEAARALKQHDDGDEKVVKQLQYKVKQFVFVRPRRIRLPEISSTPLERPLRAQTAQGPRVTVTRSDFVSEGGIIEFDLEILDGGGISRGCLRELLSYGQYVGLGQWRSGSYGRFEVLSFEEA